MRRRAILGIVLLVALAGCEKKTEPPPKVEVKSEPAVNPVIATLASGSRAMIFSAGEKDTFTSEESNDGEPLMIPIGITVTVIHDPGGVRDNRPVKILIPPNSGTYILGGDDEESMKKPYHLSMSRSMLRPIP